MAENNNQEKSHQYYLDQIYKVDHKVYYGMGKYTQFTIDLVEKNSRRTRTEQRRA